jgi:hypothetical protein
MMPPEVAEDRGYGGHVQSCLVHDDGVVATRIIFVKLDGAENFLNFSGIRFRSGPAHGPSACAGGCLAPGIPPYLAKESYSNSVRSDRLRRAMLRRREPNAIRLTGTLARLTMASAKASELDVMAAMIARTAVAPYAIPVKRK